MPPFILKNLGANINQYLAQQQQNREEPIGKLMDEPIQHQDDEEEIREPNGASGKGLKRRYKNNNEGINHVKGSKHTLKNTMFPAGPARGGLVSESSG